MKATSPGGSLTPLDKCYINIGGTEINLTSLPDISDQKGASYNDEPIIGRTQPIKTYSHSENRVISMEIYFYITEQGDAQSNLSDLRTIASAVYPRDGGGGAPYLPPYICKIRCGNLLATEDLCVILRSYSVKFPRDVIWDDETYCPYQFTVTTNWETVYKSSDLPGASRIVSSGR